MFYNTPIGLSLIRLIAPLAMLTTFSRSLPQSSSGRSAAPRLRRGAQPGNSNAYVHGLYSRSVLRPPLVPASPSPSPTDDSALLESVRLEAIAAHERILAENRLKLDKFFAERNRALPFDQAIKPLRAVGLIVGQNLRARKALHKLDTRGDLRRLALYLPPLLNWEFVEQGIPSQKVFVPLKLRNVHANWKPGLPYLTSDQCALLQKNFDSLHALLDSERVYLRRKPSPADCFLFEGIFLKLAYGLRWQDLEGKYPVRLCQDFYSALYRAGFIQSINEQLHWHLNLNGIATLEALVGQGCFVIAGNRVILAPSQDLTWEKLTALFLLQQGFHAQRAILRQGTLARRRRGGFLRLPALKLSGDAQRPAHYRPRSSGGFPIPPTLVTVRSLLGVGVVRKPPASSADLEVAPVYRRLLSTIAAPLQRFPFPCPFPDSRVSSVPRLCLESHPPISHARLEKPP